MKHVIQKQIFEIRMGNEEEAVAVQDRISSVFHKKLVQIIEKILDAHSNPNQLIRIDKLELDLGKISLYDLENDFILKLTEKLPLALSEIITNAELSSDKQGVSITTSSQSNLELLQFYLQNGALPWWRKAKNESIEEIFHQLIAERPRETAHLLQKIGSQKGVQQRLSYQFSNSLLEKIIRILIPKYALSVNTHINKIQQEFQNYRKSTITQTAFKNQLYTFTLQHIFESKNLFTLSIFKSDLKTKTTERFGFRKKETKSIFRDSTKKAPNFQKDPSVQATQSIHSQFEILRFFLKTGRLPDSSHIHTKDSLEDIFSAFLEQKPQQLIRFLQLINSPHQISQRIVHQFSKSTVARLSSLLVQEEASFVNTYFNNLDKIYDFKSSRKSKLEQQLQTNTLSFFLQKHTQFSPQNFNQHITSQLLQKNTITKKEASETFALVTERSLPKGKTSTSTAAILLPKEASPKENKTYNLIQTIEYFLEHGRIPTTTAPLLKHLSFDQLFAQLLETQATQLYLLLHQTFTKDNRQKRFIQQLPEKLFHQTIQLLQPHFAPQIHEYQKGTNRLYQRNPDFFRSKSEFQHLQRSAIIRYLLKAPNTAFDLLNFVQQSTQEISTQFSKKIPRPTHEIAKEWTTILQEKITASPIPSKEKPQPKPTASERQSPKTLIESIAYFLEYARLPDQIESDIEGLSFETLFINLLEKQAQKTYPFLRNAAKTNEAQERLILQLSEKTLLQLIEVLQPKFAGFLHMFQQSISKLHQEYPVLFKPINKAKLLRWQFLIASLIREQVDDFHPTAFTIQAIEYLSIEGEQNQKEFKRIFQNLIRRQREASQSLQNISNSLATSFLETNEESKKKIAGELLPIEQKTQVNIGEETPQTLLQKVHFFLKNQKFEGGTKEQSFEALILQFIKEDPQKIASFLQEITKKDTKQNILIHHLSDAALLRLVERTNVQTALLSEKIRQAFTKIEVQIPRFFVDKEEAKKLQWKLLIAYSLQSSKGNFAQFFAQKITNLAETRLTNEQEDKKQSLQKILKERSTRTYNLYQAVEYHLIYNRLPSKVKAEIKTHSFPQLFELLLQKQGKELLLLLQEKAKGKVLRQRLIQALPEKTLKKWVQTLQPSLEGFVKTLRLVLQKLQREKPQIIEGNPSVKMLQWEGIISYFLEKSANHFEAKSLAIHVLKTLVPSSRTKESNLLEELQGIVQEGLDSNKDDFYPLKAAIEELHKEEARKADEKKPNLQKKHSANENQTQRTLLESITYFLEFAHLPDQIEASLQGLSFEQLFTKLLEKQARNTYPLLRNAARTNEAQERLILQLSPKTLLQLVQTLQPKFADFLQNFQRLISELYQQSPILFKPVSEVKTLEWQFILAHLFTIQIDEFHPTTFASEAIKHLSIEGSEHQKEFRKNLQTLIHQQIENTQSLQTISDSLIAASQLRPNLSEKQGQATQKKERLPLPKKEEKTLNLVQSIAYFLLNKKLPRKVIKEIKGFSFDELLLQLLHQNPEKILFFLQKMTEELAEQEVLIQHASDDTLTQLLAEVDSNILSFLKLYPLIVNKLKAEKPSFFVEQKAPRILQWHLLIAYILQKTSSNLEVFIIQKIEELFAGQEEKKEFLLNPEIEQELQKGVVKNEATVEGEEKNIRRDKDFTLTQTLSFFLQNERLPNQVESGIEGLSFEALFTLFLQRHPHQVLPFLRARLKGDKEEKRLVRLLSEKTLQHLLQILQPNFVGFVETFRLAIQKLQKSDSSVFTSKASVEKSHWEAVIAYLLDERHTIFDTKFFVVYVIQFFAKVSGVASNELAEKMEGIVKEEVAAKQFRFYPLGEILEGIEDSQLTVDRESTSDLGLAVEQVEETEVEEEEILEGEDDGRLRVDGESTNDLGLTIEQVEETEVEGREVEGREVEVEFFLEGEDDRQPMVDGETNNDLGLVIEQVKEMEHEGRKVEGKEDLEEGEEILGNNLSNEEIEDTKQYSLTQTLSFFLQNERLPNQVEPGIEGLSFEALFTLFLQKNPHQVLPFLRARLKETQKQKRLIRLLSENTLQRLLQTLQPNFVGFMETVRLAIQKLQESKSSVFTFKTSLKESHWGMTIAYLLDDKYTIFDTKSFVKYGVQSLAKVNRIDSVKLTKELQKIVEEEVAAKQFRFYPLEEILQGIGDGELTVGDKVLRNDGKSTLDEAEEMFENNAANEDLEDFKEYSLTQALGFFLQNERLPNQVESAIEGLSFEALFTLFLQKHPNQVLPFLRIRLKGRREQKRLIRLLSEQTLQYLLQTLQPNFAGFVETFRLAIQKLQESDSSIFTSKAGIENSHWDTTIAYLLDGKNTTFDTKSFVKYGVQSFSKVTQIGPEELSEKLEVVVKKEVAAKQFRFYPLEEILKSVNGEEMTTEGGVTREDDGQKVKGVKKRKSIDEKEQEEDTENRSNRELGLEDLLAYFLEHGLLPESLPRKWRGMNFGQLFAEFLEKSPQKTLPLLREEAKMNERQERLIKQLSEKILQQLEKVMAGNHAVFAESFRVLVLDLAASNGEVFKAENSSFVHWQSVIAYFVGEDKGFDRLGFLVFVIRYLSEKSNLSAEELLLRLQTKLKEREAKDGVQILKASMESLAKIAKVVFGEGEGVEEEKTEIVETVSTPIEQELKRIGLKINEEDIFDMREAVHYLYGYKTYLKKYTKTEFEALFRELMRTYPDTTKATLVTLLGDDDVLEKILDDFSEETYHSVVSLLQPSLAKKIGQYLKDMAVMFKVAVVRRELLLYLKEIDEFSFSLMDFIHQILKVSVGEDKNEYGRILITSIQYLRMTKLASKEEFRTALSELKIKHDVRARDIKTKGPKRATSLDEKAKSNKSLLEQTVYVQNAGLVLIYPFLSRYFNYLGMLEENKFKDEETAHRGVLLLQFLATGFSESPEHELVLNKLLCGLPLNTPVPLKIEMTEKETQISEQMLQGVIQNWKRLNNMTAGNFRGSFLLREGKLEEKEKFWQLKVEKKAWDLLLKTLPWGFSIVRIPWMEKMINVEWEV